MNWIESFANAVGMGVLAATAAAQLFEYWRRQDPVRPAAPAWLRAVLVRQALLLPAARLWRSRACRQAPPAGERLSCGRC